MLTISDYKVIPVVDLSSIEELDSLLLFLREIDHKIAEITLRNEKSFQLVEHAKENYKDFKIGVGTILNKLQFKKAVNLNVDFLVSPGYTKTLIDYSKFTNIPYIPAAATISEVMELIRNDFKIIKLFPINTIGGVEFIKSVSAVIKESKIKFMPTGGIGFDNVESYLEFPAIAACGSSSIFKDPLSNRAKIENIVKGRQ